MIGILAGCGTTSVSSSVQGTTTTPTTNAASQTSNSVSKKAKNKSTPNTNTSGSSESQIPSSAGKFVFTKPPHMWNDKQGWATASVLSLNKDTHRWAGRHARHPRVLCPKCSHESVRRTHEHYRGCSVAVTDRVVKSIHSIGSSSSGDDSSRTKSAVNVGG